MVCQILEAFFFLNDKQESLEFQVPTFQELYAHYMHHHFEIEKKITRFLMIYTLFRGKCLICSHKILGDHSNSDLQGQTSKGQLEVQVFLYIASLTYTYTHAFIRKNIKSLKKWPEKEKDQGGKGKGIKLNFTEGIQSK